MTEIETGDIIIARDVGGFHRKIPLRCGPGRVYI